MALPAVQVLHGCGELSVTYFKFQGSIDLCLWALPIALVWSFAPAPERNYFALHILCLVFLFEWENAA